MKYLKSTRSKLRKEKSGYINVRKKYARIRITAGIKRYFYTEDTNILNLHATNKSFKIYEGITEKNKREAGKSKVGDVNAPLSVFDNTSRHKISGDIQDLGKTVNQLDLIDIDKTLQQTTAEYTFFSSLHGIVMEIEHLLDFKMF